MLTLQKRRTLETAAYIADVLETASEEQEALDVQTDLEEPDVVALDTLLSETGKDTTIFVTHEPIIDTYGRILAERHGILLPDEDELTIKKGEALDLNLAQQSYRVLQPL